MSYLEKLQQSSTRLFPLHAACKRPRSSAETRTSRSLSLDFRLFLSCLQALANFPATDRTYDSREAYLSAKTFSASDAERSTTSRRDVSMPRSAAAAASDLSADKRAWLAAFVLSSALIGVSPISFRAQACIVSDRSGSNFFKGLWLRLIVLRYGWPIQRGYSDGSGLSDGYLDWDGYDARIKITEMCFCERRWKNLDLSGVDDRIGCSETDHVAIMLMRIKFDKDLLGCW